MAKTLEAAITVPTLIGLTLGFLAGGIRAYGEFRQMAQLDAGRLAREKVPVAYRIELTEEGLVKGISSRPELLLRQGAAVEDLIRLMFRHVTDSAEAATGRSGP
ncbi:MAG: hypothetical protein QM296_07830 [Bacillota bacterium]|nr:hypothetical protein [Bacillota bacterium]